MINKNNTFNNELEEILEDKAFDENVKSSLLNIFYRIEQSYKDYSKVKVDADLIDEYIKKLMNNIKDSCNEIKLVTPNSKQKLNMESRTFRIDKEKKRIICLNVDRKLLYCLFKIAKKENIVNDKYLIIDRTISDLINVGYTINEVEPFRDFNGYSWSPAPSEIESIDHNLIFQKLLIILGKDFLEDWVKLKNTEKDYWESAILIMKKQYEGNKIDEYIERIKIISFLLDVKYNKDIYEHMYKKKNKIEKRLDKLSNREKFIEEITAEKKKLTKEIKRLDEIINNKDRLREEYKKRNEKLQMEEKIFSPKVLTTMLEEERYRKIGKIEKFNNILKPQKFVEYEGNLKEQYKYLKLLDKRNIDKEIEKNKIYLEKNFLDIWKKKIERIDSKQELLEKIYQFRYYITLPYTREEKVYENKEAQEKIKEILMIILEKSHDLKIIQRFSKNKQIDYELLKSIFISHSIKLEQISIKLIKTKDNNKLYIETYDEETLERKEEFLSINEVQNKDFEIRYNKKVKAFY